MFNKYVGLAGITETASTTLDKVLLAYFNSDTALHGIEVETKSLRSDMVDGSDHLANIKASLTSILGKYFDSFTLELDDGGLDGNVKYIELTITVTESGKTITFDNILSIANGELSGIVDRGHL